MELFDQFATATYSVEGLGDLFVTQPLPKSIVQWMRVNGTTTFAMVGAQNPQGVKVSDEQNELLHNELLKYCEERSFTWLPATGRGDNWSESGAAIIGISREGAREIMHKFDQAAVLFAEIDSVVEMIE